jgi:hypothetical protein
MQIRFGCGLVSRIYSIFVFCRQRGQRLLNSDLLDDASIQSPQSPVGLPSSYDQIETPGPSNDVTSTGSLFARCHSDSSLDETDIDILQDADNDKDVFRFVIELVILYVIP